MNKAFKLHAIVRLIKTGNRDDPLYIHRLLLLCAAAVPHSLSCARALFATLPSPDTFAYNTIIRAHAHFSPSHSLSLFSNMRRAGISPDFYTFPFVLKACGRLQIGREVHSMIVKMGLDDDIYAQNGLICFYGLLGSVWVARQVFDEMTERDLVSWSSLISCFSNRGLGHEALGVFQAMQLVGEVTPDVVTMLSVISAVSNLGALELGRWVEAFIVRSGFEFSVSLGTALVDMYSRCGSVDDSVRVFDEMPVRNVFTWTALITGLAVHGRGREALVVFYEMKKSGLKPDCLTFNGVLVACSHSALVDEGWRVFKSIKNDYGMEPTIENYGCLVDLLGRAGLLNEGVQFIETMPVKPNAIIWRTLLGACVNHNNLDLAEKVKKKIHELDPYHDGDYVLLSNAYGGVCRWNEKAHVRTSMREKRINKKPGYSLLTVDEMIYEFLSGDCSHLEANEIKKLLVSISDSLRDQGYTPSTSVVLHDIEEEEKEHSLNFHSEKLAIAFALLNFSNRKTIRITKNVRICHDCHCFMKHVSKKFDREIIIRDRNRFHHFRKGSCSCQDFW